MTVALEAAAPFTEPLGDTLSAFLEDADLARLADRMPGGNRK